MTKIELLNRLNDLVGECFIGRISQNDAKVGIRRAIEEYDLSDKNSREIGRESDINFQNINDL